MIKALQAMVDELEAKMAAAPKASGAADDGKKVPRLALAAAVHRRGLRWGPGANRHAHEAREQDKMIKALQGMVDGARSCNLFEPCRVALAHAHPPAHRNARAHTRASMHARTGVGRPSHGCRARGEAGSGAQGERCGRRWQEGTATRSGGCRAPALLGCGAGSESARARGS